MNKILKNIFSNWANLALMIVIAFIVSPVLVHGLGNELYGTWTLLSALTGYFTILDFGVNTAIVRYISKYNAQKKYDTMNSVYNSSFVFFIAICTLFLIGSVFLGLFLNQIFNIDSIPKKYLYIVFMIVCIDMSLNLIFSVFQGTLVALEHFFEINCISMVLSIVKSIVLVVLISRGFGILTMAVLQLLTTMAKYSAQYFLIKRNYSYLKINVGDSSYGMFKQIFNYSAYSFIIAISLKLLFYTDSLVIGGMLNLEAVTFYAIPSTLVDYLEKLVWAMICVFVPIISSFNATNENSQNANFYIISSKYTLLFCIPIVYVLFTIGDDFITIWMGYEYSVRSFKILCILLVGYLFSIPQLSAHGVLKGISKHRVLSFILIFEAVANLCLSLTLVKGLGLIGVALGTTIPLVVANVIIIPLYTCHTLGINPMIYYWKSYVPAIPLVVVLYFTANSLEFNIATIYGVVAYSLVVAILVVIYSFFFIVDHDLRFKIYRSLKLSMHEMIT